jgi:hypothetical protein
MACNRNIFTFTKYIHIFSRLSEWGGDPISVPDQDSLSPLSGSGSTLAQLILESVISKALGID